MYSSRLLQVQDDHQKELRRVAEYWKETLQRARNEANSEKEEATGKLKIEIERLESVISVQKASQDTSYRDLEAKFDREKELWKQQQITLMAAELERERIKAQAQVEQTCRAELNSTIKQLAEDQAVLISRLEGKYEGELRELREKMASPREGKKGKRKTPKLELETPTLSTKGRRPE